MRRFPQSADLCYTFNVENKRQLWQAWARKLHQWGMAKPAADLLQAGGPLRILAAQFAYLGQPVMDPFLKRGTLGALAELLEDEAEARSFIACLQEEEKA